MTDRYRVFSLFLKKRGKMSKAHTISLSPVNFELSDEEGALRRSEAMIRIVHSPSGIEWNVKREMLASCSPVFARMFEEPRCDNRSHISLFECDPSAASMFLDIATYSRNEKTFEELAKNLDVEKVSGLLIKYEACESLLPLLVDLVERCPTLANIQVCDELLLSVKSWFPNKWGTKSLDLIIAKTTTSHKELSQGGCLERDYLTKLDTSTLCGIIARMAWLHECDKEKNEFITSNQTEGGGWQHSSSRPGWLFSRRHAIQVGVAAAAASLFIAVKYSSSSTSKCTTSAPHTNKWAIPFAKVQMQKCLKFLSEKNI